MPITKRYPSGYFNTSGGCVLIFGGIACYVPGEQATEATKKVKVKGGKPGEEEEQTFVEFKKK